MYKNRLNHLDAVFTLAIHLQKLKLYKKINIIPALECYTKDSQAFYIFIKVFKKSNFVKLNTPKTKYFKHFRL